MNFQQKDMSGALFKNTRKEKDTHPDYNGTVLIDGRDYWISGWIKQGAKGSFLSLAFKRKEEQRQQSLSQQAQAKIKRPDPISTGRHPNGYDGRDMGGDDIPFEMEWRI